MAYQLDFSALLRGEYLDRLASGLMITVLLTGIAWAMAFILGILLLLVRMVPLKACGRAVALYVEYHQNVPLLVQMLFWYFVVPTLLPPAGQRWINAHDSEFILAALALTFCYGAYNSEAFRSGIRAIPATQYESGRVLGFNHVQTLVYVIIPQALRNAVPMLTNISLGLFKGTSIAMAIGVHELTYESLQIENQTFRTFEVFAVATVAYLIVSLIIARSGAALERACSVSR